MIGARSGRRCWFGGSVRWDRFDRAGLGAAPRRGGTLSAPCAFTKNREGGSIGYGRSKPEEQAAGLTALVAPLCFGGLQ